MTALTLRASAPSFPPADDLLALLRSVDWRAAAAAALTAALTAAAFIHALALRSAPYVARALRALADRIDASPAPLTSLTVTELRARARAAGLSRALYTSGRRADLLAALS